MKSPFQGLADLINSHPRYIVLAAAIIVIAAFFGMSFVTMATGSDTYLDKNTKRGMLLDDYTATFQSDSILVLIETDGILTPSVLSYIEVTVCSLGDHDICHGNPETRSDSGPAEPGGQQPEHPGQYV